MPEPEQQPQDPRAEQPKPAPKKDDAPSKGDIAALGIGCLVFVIFFVAIVLVGMTREG